MCNPRCSFCVLFLSLVEAEEQFQTAIDTAESHEGHGQQTGSDEGDGHTFDSLRHLVHGQLFAQSGEEHHGEEEAEGGGEGIDNALQQVVVLLDDEDGNAEDTAVGRDERKEHAECLVEAGRHFLQDDFDHLHECGDDEDEGNRLQVAEAVGVEHELLDEVSDNRGQREHEGHGHTHARGGADLLRNSEEGADSEELRQDDIVNEYRCDEDKNVFHNYAFLILLTIAMR